VSLSRLVVLGLLAEHGPMHGHQLRRRADAMHVECWGGVSPGALYRELHQLEAEELIELLRNEQIGRRPPRTVYRITDSGRSALRALRDEALGQCARPPDVVGVGLLFGAFEDPARVRELLERRHRATAEALEMLIAKRKRLDEQGAVSLDVRTVFRRGELYLQAELAWHDEYTATFATATVNSAGAGIPRAGAQGGTPSRRGSTSLEDATTLVALQEPGR
jgi:DNA-binding PadR family transcriptional regulator